MGYVGWRCTLAGGEKVHGHKGWQVACGDGDGVRGAEGVWVNTKMNIHKTVYRTISLILALNNSNHNVHYLLCNIYTIITIAVRYVQHIQSIYNIAKV